MLVRGAHFSARAAAHALAVCRLSHATAAAHVVDDTLLQCTSPPLSSAPAALAYRQTFASPATPVAVSMNSADFTVASSQFRYLPLELLSATPSFGPTLGGTLILVKGAHFANHNLRCHFLSVGTAPATVLTATSLKCLSPPSTNGPASMLVMSDSGHMRSHLPGVRFHYLTFPSLLSLLAVEQS